MLTTLAALALAAHILPAAPAESKQARGSSIEVRFEGLRNNRGLVRLCLNRDPRHFPNCADDPNARKVNIPASSRTYVFENVPIGSFVISALHDENGDGRLNSVLGIPREGFAFSNNPRVRFGTPSYARVRFNVGPERAVLRLQFNYMV